MPHLFPNMFGSEDPTLKIHLAEQRELHRFKTEPSQAAHAGTFLIMAPEVCQVLGKGDEEQDQQKAESLLKYYITISNPAYTIFYVDSNFYLTPVCIIGVVPFPNFEEAGMFWFVSLKNLEAKHNYCFEVLLALKKLHQRYPILTSFCKTEWQGTLDWLQLFGFKKVAYFKYCQQYNGPAYQVMSFNHSFLRMV